MFLLFATSFFLVNITTFALLYLGVASRMKKKDMDSKNSNFKVRQTGQVVFVDAPDPDNLLMCIQSIRDSEDPVAVVLCPRPLDLTVKPYDDEVRTEMREKFGREHIKMTLYPLKSYPDWWEKLSPHAREFFAPDAFFSDAKEKPELFGYISEDQILYMKVTALRFACKLDEIGTPRDRYTFYWDPKAMDRVVGAVRHAAHIPDYSYGFNDQEQERFEVANAMPTGTKRREVLLSILNDYVSKRVKYFELSSVDEMLHNFDELLDTNHDRKGPGATLVVGGAFTDVLRYIDSGLPLGDVYAMGGFLSGQQNLFKNQFNFNVDMQSAEEFLRWSEGRMAEEHRRRLTLIPTECCKGDRCPFQLAADEVDDIFRDAPTVHRLMLRYKADTKAANILLFDWIAALVIRNGDLLPTRPYNWYLDDDVIRFREQADGPVNMCINDEEYMKRTKPDLIRQMKETLRHWQGQAKPITK
ncbi:hypothetical protein BX600DRAFT_105157 [Xylariales sp. PMI_506]|nr:hypothetical protein BX600DRAFT_105157 [Xylariales sp. PMI_506]